jgi:hypothetical protein
MTEPTSTHFRQVAMKIAEGAVTPFLGAGVNLCDRDPKDPWEVGKQLPSGVDLAGHLVTHSAYPGTDRDLLRVSQYFAACLGEADLYERLRALFNTKYPPSSVHRFLATLPARIRELRESQERKVPYQLILTTNYDLALETAFDDEGEEYDVVWYEAKHSEDVPRGKFWHRPPGEGVEPQLIMDPSDHKGLSLEERTIILKLHGAVDPDEESRDSFVITEDDYIAYLTGGDISAAIPVKLKARMEQTHFLFLGYSMSDWNLRVILNRIWGARKLGRTSWAVQLRPEDDARAHIEEQLWQKRGEKVVPLYAPLKGYIEELEEALSATTPVAV